MMMIKTAVAAVSEAENLSSNAGDGNIGDDGGGGGDDGDSSDEDDLVMMSLTAGNIKY